MEKFDKDKGVKFYNLFAEYSEEIDSIIEQLQMKRERFRKRLNSLMDAIDVDAPEEETEPPPVPDEKHDIFINNSNGTSRYWDEKTRQWVDTKPVAAGPNGEMELDIFLTGGS